MLALAGAVWIALGATPSAARPSDPLSVSTPAPPARPLPEHRLLLQPSLFGRVNPYSINPLGVEAHLLLAYQRRFYASEDPLFRENYYLFGLKPQLNPAQSVLAAVAEAQPASFFNLRVSVEYWGFFGSFGAVQSFASPAVDFSGQTLRDRWAAGLNVATGGLRVALAPTFQAAWKGFALRLRPSFDFYALRLRPGDSYWYNGRTDTLLAGRGWVATGEADLLYTGLSRWTIGAMYSASVPLYEGSDAALRTQNAFQRIGPLVAFTLFDKGYAKFDRPTVFLLMQWFIQHRWATVDANRAIPFGVLGVSATSDFL